MSKPFTMLLLPVIGLAIALYLVPGATYTVNAEEEPPLRNEKLINRLVECESGGHNVSRMDSNHRISDGILQFNRGESNIMGSGTWQEMSRQSGINGLPVFPKDARKMADWMIDHNYGPRWSCWKILHLKK